MAGAGGGGTGRSLESTPTWAVAIVCFVLVIISILIEHSIHLLGKWLTKKHKRALYEALEKIKSELMLLGFISLLLTVGQGFISQICISPRLGSTMLPCERKSTPSFDTSHESNSGPFGESKLLPHEVIGRKLLWSQTSGAGFRRILAGGGGGPDKCAPQGKVPLVSSEGINQLHIFIFVLAVFHVLYCITTMALGRAKMRSWKTWERECKTMEYQFSHDPERFRFARETSFGRRHLHFWGRIPVLIWIVCFFRQFVASVPKVDYLTLRHGFIMAHLAPQSSARFDFHKYIKRSLEEDFQVVVGISPTIWFFAVLFLLFYTHGLFSYFWLPFIPLVIILLVGTKLQVVITRMGLEIQDKGDVVKGVPVVHPTDHLFWFNSPRLILYLIHFVLFQNAFQMAFFIWAWYQFGLHSCFHRNVADISIRISMGVMIQFLCSYVTLPLYALVTQMGTNLKPTIFHENVANALKRWYNSARKNLKESRKPGYVTPMSSRPTTPRSSHSGTPTHGLSPVHLLRHYRSDFSPSRTSPRFYNIEGRNPADSTSPSHHNIGEGSSSHNPRPESPSAHDVELQEVVPSAVVVHADTKEFSFSK